MSDSLHPDGKGSYYEEVMCDRYQPLPDLHRVVMVQDAGRWRPAILREENRSRKNRRVV